MSQSAQMPDPVRSPSEPAATHPIDMDHLLHYTMDDEDLAREVLTLFSQQGLVYLEQLTAAATENEKKIAAHTLKGSAQGVGAHEVARKALALETLAGTQDIAGWDRALKELETAFAATGSFIADLS